MTFDKNHTSSFARWHTSYTVRTSVTKTRVLQSYCADSREGTLFYDYIYVENYEIQFRGNNTSILKTALLRICHGWETWKFGVPSLLETVFQLQGPTFSRSTEHLLSCIFFLKLTTQPHPLLFHVAPLFSLFTHPFSLQFQSTFQDHYPLFAAKLTKFTPWTTILRSWG